MDFSKIILHDSNKTYTKIVEATPDPATVRLLKDLYTGNVSETGAVFQYVFQGYVSESHNKEISELFLKIAEQEMEHHKLLGDAICAFGGDPNYMNSKGVMFSARSVAQCTNLKDMLIADIKSETADIYAYEDASSCVTNISLKQMINEIIEDEKRHKEIFEMLLMETNFWC